MLLATSFQFSLRIVNGDVKVQGRPVHINGLHDEAMTFMKYSKKDENGGQK